MCSKRGRFLAINLVHASTTGGIAARLLTFPCLEVERRPWLGPLLGLAPSPEKQRAALTADGELVDAPLREPGLAEMHAADEEEGRRVHGRRVR